MRPEALNGAPKDRLKLHHAGVRAPEALPGGCSTDTNRAYTCLGIFSLAPWCRHSVVSKGMSFAAPQKLSCKRRLRSQQFPHHCCTPFRSIDPTFGPHDLVCLCSGSATPSVAAAICTCLSVCVYTYIYVYIFHMYICMCVCV